MAILKAIVIGFEQAKAIPPWRNPNKVQNDHPR